MEKFTNTSTLSPSKNLFENKDTKIRAVVGVSCCLSILGSLLIILSYILFKKRRTRAREILLHISLMDLGVALSNLIGLSVYFDKYYFQSHENVTAYIDGLCKTQAFFAAYSTFGSILWTIALAAFLYFLIIHHRTKGALYFLRCAYLVCYALPLLVSMWLVLTGKLGHSPLDSSGWCTLISNNLATGKVDIFSTIFGNDLWVYLAIITIPVFYLSVRCYLSSQVNAVKDIMTPERFWSSLHHVEYKFLSIPVVFVFLRMWSAIMSVLYDYIQLDVEQVPNTVNLVLLYLSGIGDSSQGFANAIIFVIFTKNIRDSFIDCLTCWKRKKDDSTTLEAEVGQIQGGSNPTSILSVVTSDNKPIVKEDVTNSDNEVDHAENASLLYSSLSSNLQQEHSDYFQRYGAVS